MGSHYSEGSGFGTKTRVTLEGNTYNHRDWIKEMGGTWGKKTKKWTIPVPSNNKGCAQLAFELRKRGLTWK